MPLHQHSIPSSFELLIHESFGDNISCFNWWKGDRYRGRGSRGNEREEEPCMAGSHNFLSGRGEISLCTYLAEEVGGPDSGLLQTNMVTSSDVLQ